ncbi:MAG: ABC transporter ATP-binding protein [Sphingobacteriales bacterium]|nr:ABC transporter ATP-binding protein [Sphingobacteriales bacterium]
MVNQENIAVKAKQLTRKFGDFIATKELTLEVKKGEIFGFLGANGAGKTTAMRMLCGLLKPSSGEATVAGFDVYKEAEKIKKNIGYMSQKFSLYEDLKVTENISLFGGIYGLNRKEIKLKTQNIIEDLNLHSVANKLVRAIPLGWKQKLAFAVAQVHDPKIIFLDEPTGGVDPLTRRQFWNEIYASADRGLTIFVTTHYMDEAEYCHRVSIMVDGEVKALGTPRELKNQYQVNSMDDVFTELARGTSTK